MKFRKKPVVIEAMQWTGEAASTLEIESFVGAGELEWKENPNYKDYKDRWFLMIPTLESPHEASVGDWIIKGIKGEFYPCKPDVFEQTYEKVEE